MLHSITLKSLRGSIVKVHGKSHSDCAFGVRRPFAVIFVYVQIIGDHSKLLARHLENFVVVNRVHRCGSATLSFHGKVAICAWQVASSTAKLWIAATRKVWVAHASRVLASASRNRRVLQWIGQPFDRRSRKDHFRGPRRNQHAGHVRYRASGRYSRASTSSEGIR